MNLTQILETVGTSDEFDPEQTLKTIATLEREAREWVEQHRTKIVNGQSGHRPPGLDGGTVMSLRRDNTDQWGANFDRMLGYFLADALKTMGEVETELFGSVVAYTDDAGTLLTSFTGIIKDYDNQNVIFWDDTTVSRDYILEIGI